MESWVSQESKQGCITCGCATGYIAASLQCSLALHLCAAPRAAPLRCCGGKGYPGRPQPHLPPPWLASPIEPSRTQNALQNALHRPAPHPATHLSLHRLVVDGTSMTYSTYLQYGTVACTAGERGEGAHLVCVCGGGGSWGSCGASLARCSQWHPLSSPPLHSRTLRCWPPNALQITQCQLHWQHVAGTRCPSLARNELLVQSGHTLPHAACHARACTCHTVCVARAPRPAEPCN